MRKPFYEAFGELADQLEPGQVLEWPAEACIFYDLMPKYQAIIVKYENNLYRALRGDEVVKVIMGASPDYLPDEAELTRWRQAANRWLHRLEWDIVQSRVDELMIEELIAMTEGKI